MQFLVPAITPGKSVDSIQVIESASAKDSSHHTPEKISQRYDNKRKLKSTPLSEKRLKALNSCVNILEKSLVSENKNDEISYFCKNLDEKLKKMDCRQRILLEKKINDLVFDTEIRSLPRNDTVQDDETIEAHFNNSPIEAHFNNSRTNFNAFSPTVDNIIRSSRNSSFNYNSMPFQHTQQQFSTAMDYTEPVSCSYSITQAVQSLTRPINTLNNELQSDAFGLKASFGP